ncbi:MAG: hypothetical protein ABIJ03_03575 [Patescibacteria group bacterium]|nr:BrnA antitoxin family protein [Patescibacteria group bacterium]
MNTNIATSTTIKLNLPAGILQNTQIESKRIGISIQDFVRMLLATYFAHAPSLTAINHDRVLYQEALKDIKHGCFTDVSNVEELNYYLQTLE